jgi:phthiocerol/phenolphthiocerol synthesis type-I polyketide synthase B
MPDEVAIHALRAITCRDTPARCTIVAADWARLATAYRTRASLHIIDELARSNNGLNADTTATPTTDFRDALRNCEPTRRRAMLVDHVTALVASVMGLDSPQSLDPSVGFFQFGMDSLMCVTLQRDLGETLGLAVPASAVFDYPTVEALTDYLVTHLPELTEVADQQAVDAYDNFTDAELLHQLSERLSVAR